MREITLCIFFSKIRSWLKTNAYSAVPFLVLAKLRDKRIGVVWLQTHCTWSFLLQILDLSISKRVENKSGGVASISLHLPITGCELVLQASSEISPFQEGHRASFIQNNFTDFLSSIELCCPASEFRFVVSRLSGRIFGNPSKAGEREKWYQYFLESTLSFTYFVHEYFSSVRVTLAWLESLRRLRSILSATISGGSLYSPNRSHSSKCRLSASFSMRRCLSFSSSRLQRFVRGGSKSSGIWATLESFLRLEAAPCGLPSGFECTCFQKSDRKIRPSWNIWGE